MISSRRDPDRLPGTRAARETPDVGSPARFQGQPATDTRRPVARRYVTDPERSRFRILIDTGCPRSDLGRSNGQVWHYTRLRGSFSGTVPR